LEFHKNRRRSANYSGKIFPKIPKIDENTEIISLEGVSLDRNSN
jgi:hypothetical protein